MVVGKTLTQALTPSLLNLITRSRCLPMMMRDIGTAHQLSRSAGTTIDIRRVIALTASPTRAFTAIPSHMRTVALVNTPSARQLSLLACSYRSESDLRCSRQHHPRPPRLVQTRDEVYAHQHITHCGEPFAVGGGNHALLRVQAITGSRETT